MSDPRISDAASLYQRISGLGSGTGNASSGGADFSSMVGSAIGSSINQLKQTEHVTASGLLSQASLEDMALAISSAETTLRTVVAIRDRVISAYQDIIKMPI